MEENNTNNVKDSNEQALISSIESALSNWSQWFKDYVKGEDVARWQQKASSVLVPLAINGYEAGPMSMGGILDAKDTIDMIVPAYFSNEESSAAVGPGGKAKLKGMAQGLIFFIDDQIGFVHEAGSMYLLYRTESKKVKAAHKVKFGLSLVSMTSAGQGYELILDDGPLVFRLGLVFNGSYYENEFDALLNKLLA